MLATDFAKECIEYFSTHHIRVLLDIMHESYFDIIPTNGQNARLVSVDNNNGDHIICASSPVTLINIYLLYKYHACGYN